MYPTHVFILTAILMAGTIFSACKPSAQHQDIVQAQVQYVALPSDKEKRDAMTATQNASMTQEWETLKNTFEGRFRENEIRIAELKAKMKRIATLEQTNRKLKVSIDTYEQGKVDWELFKRAFNYDMQALGKELQELSWHNKK